MYILHDNTWDGKKDKWKNENELPQVGFEPTTLCTPDRCTCDETEDGN